MTRTPPGGGSRPISVVQSVVQVLPEDRFGTTLGALGALSGLSLWRNRLARSAVNRKVGGSSPPRDDSFA